FCCSYSDIFLLNTSVYCCYLQFIFRDGCQCLCDFHTDLTRDNKIGCPSLSVQLHSCADFPIQEADVSTSTRKDNNGIGFTETISQGKLFSLQVKYQPSNKCYQDHDIQNNSFPHI